MFQLFLPPPGIALGVGLRSLKCAAGRSALAPLSGILDCPRLILANLLPGLPFFVALLCFFALSLFLLSLCMTIMGTWWVTNYLSGRPLSLYSVTGLAIGYIEGGYLQVGALGYV